MPHRSNENAGGDVASVVLEFVTRESGREARIEDRLNDLGIDSLALSGFIGVVEREFRIEVDSEIMDVDTLEELVRYIESRR